MESILAAGMSRKDGEFSIFLSVHRERLRRVASAYSRPTERDDLFQEIVVALWGARSTFRGECSEKTFVYRVAHNVALKACLRRPTPTTAVPEDLACADPLADEAVARKVDSERLRNAVRALPLGERQVVVLALEELSHREIADITGLTEGHVAVRLHRAKNRLKEILDQPAGRRLP
jgi:RNA polymerase sigma factor (sigma-70 family)